MNNEERQAVFDKLGIKLTSLISEFEDAHNILSDPNDRNGITEIITDLTWAAENCTVIGMHQIGQALDDKLGV